MKSKSIVRIGTYKGLPAIIFINGNHVTISNVFSDATPSSSFVFNQAKATSS